MALETVTRWRIKRDGYRHSDDTDVFVERNDVAIARGKRTLLFTRNEIKDVILALGEALNRCPEDNDQDVPF